MRPRTLLVLFLLVAGLASFIWFVERDVPGTDERAERARKLLLFEPEHIARLRIERGAERVVLERAAASAEDGRWNSAENGEWNLVEPLVARADGGAVNSVLAQLASLDKERTFADGQAAELGLSPPRASVSVSGSEGEHRVLIGSDVPASESMIAAVEAAGPFHVVPRSAWDEMDRSVEEWRERTVFPGLRGEIERMTFERGSNRVTMARRGDAFFLEEPLEDRVDQGTISRFLDALVDLEVAEFVDQGRAAGGDFGEDFGFSESPPALEVFSRGSEVVWRLELGTAAGDEQSEDDSIFVRTDGHVYIVPDTIGDAFDRPADEWRSLEWAGLQVHEIDRLEVRDAAGTIALERDAGDWLRDGIKIEFGPVSDLLYALVGTKAEALDAEEAIAGDPLLSATINEGDGQRVVEVFAPTGDAHPATVSDRQAALWLGGDAVRDIVSKVAAVRAATALDEPAGGDAGETDAEPAPVDASAAAAASN